MKKIMTMAIVAMAAVAGIANDCSPVTVEVADPTIVYSVKMSVKTTKGNAGVTTVNTGTACTPGENVSTVSVVRVPDTTKFEGYIYDCTATCSTIADGSCIMWDSKRKAQLADAAFTPTFINVIGTKQADAEWAWTFAGTAEYDTVRTQAYALTGAGLGKFSTKKGYYTSFSGNFAGTAAASYDLSKSAAKLMVCEPSQVWQCSDLTALTDSDTVAYGTWAIKYNATASKRYAAGKSLKVPAYVTVE